MFKVGDKVICTDVSNVCDNWLTLHKTYEIIEIKGMLLYIIDDTNALYGYHNGRFKLLTQASGPIVPTWQPCPTCQCGDPSCSNVQCKPGTPCLCFVPRDLDIFKDDEIVTHKEVITKIEDQKKKMSTCTCDFTTVLLPYGCKCGGV